MKIFFTIDKEKRKGTLQRTCTKYPSRTYTRQMEASPFPLEFLPSEIFIAIILELPVKNIVSSFCITCKEYYAMKNNRHLWKTLVLKDFPIREWMGNFPQCVPENILFYDIYKAFLVLREGAIHGPAGTPNLHPNRNYPYFEFITLKNLEKKRRMKRVKEIMRYADALYTLTQFNPQGLVKIKLLARDIDKTIRKQQSVSEKDGDDSSGMWNRVVVWYPQGQIAQEEMCMPFFKKALGMVLEKTLCSENLELWCSLLEVCDPNFLPFWAGKKGSVLFESNPTPQRIAMVKQFFVATFENEVWVPSKMYYKLFVRAVSQNHSCYMDIIFASADFQRWYDRQREESIQSIEKRGKRHPRGDCFPGVIVAKYATRESITSLVKYDATLNNPKMKNRLRKKNNIDALKAFADQSAPVSKEPGCLTHSH